MILEPYFAFTNWKNGTIVIIEFTTKTKEGPLPFPLGLTWPVKCAISSTLFIILLSGIYFRKIIFDYLRAPETKIGAINYLIWIDQLNGIFMGINILIKCIEISLPVPSSAFVGADVCRWVDLPGCFYIIGSYVWSCFTAVYRILCMKCQSWVFNVVGEEILLKVTRHVF